jgi:hypothetical protein
MRSLRRKDWSTSSRSLGRNWWTRSGPPNQALEPWFSTWVDKLKGFGDIFVDAFKTMDFDKVLSALQTGFIGGIFLLLKKALGKGLPPIFGGALEGVNKMLGGLTNNLEAMQRSSMLKLCWLSPEPLLVLAGGIFVLSTIDGESWPRP